MLITMKTCFDCSKPISRQGTRCLSCGQKERFTRLKVWNKGLVTVLPQFLLCKNCKKQFATFRKTKIPSFCSRECHGRSKIGKTPISAGWNAGTKGQNTNFPNCVDCNKKLKTYKAQRCLSCHGKKVARYGKNNSNWKGDQVSYISLHTWVNRHLGKATECLYCRKEGTGHEIHWANISHKYKRDLSDWMSLCQSCHFKYDGVGYKSWETRRRNQLYSLA